MADNSSVRSSTRAAEPSSTRRPVRIAIPRTRRYPAITKETDCWDIHGLDGLKSLGQWFTVLFRKHLPVVAVQLGHSASRVFVGDESS